jgi:ABC-type multidrug transport system ATPase subunit
MIQIIDLSFSYPKTKTPLLKSVNFCFEKGDTVLLEGVNGSGKSTLLKLMAGIGRASSGRIVWEGKENLGSGPSLAIGYLPQDPVYWNEATCEEQFYFLGRAHGLGKSEIRTRLEYIFSHLNLKDKSDTIAKKLSGGMKRRLSLALTLLPYPDYLLLDEPFVNLDKESIDLLIDLISEFKSRYSPGILITSHQQEFPESLSAKKILLKNGELILL